MCGIVGYVGPDQALPIVIEGLRRALLDGADLAAEWPLVWPALLVGLLSVPIGLRAFIAAERYAKRTGRLKRSG